MKTHSFIFPFLGSLTSTPISIFFWETLVPHHTTDAGENYEPWPFIGRSEVHATCTGISWSFYKLEHTEKRQTILLWVQASGWVWDPSDLVEEIFTRWSPSLHSWLLDPDEFTRVTSLRRAFRWKEVQCRWVKGRGETPSSQVQFPGGGRQGVKRFQNQLIFLGW